MCGAGCSGHEDPETGHDPAEEGEAGRGVLVRVVQSAADAGIQDVCEVPGVPAEVREVRGLTGCRFYLGTHLPNWLADDRFAAVPLMVSAIRLRKSRVVPVATGRWALDSGGFSELSQNGWWTVDAMTYSSVARGWRDRIGGLDWCAIQDWMCEPFITAKTGLSVREHQRRTVHSWHLLRRLAPDLPWVPVLQGWEEEDYLRHVEMYRESGTELSELPLVGVGSVCRRQGTEEAERIIGRLARAGIRLHLFGFKLKGLRACARLAESADSMAWSSRARFAWDRDKLKMLPTCEHKGGCGNCRAWALYWRNHKVGPMLRRPSCLFGGVA